MTKFLISDDNLEGYKLEDILIAIRKDILMRCEKVVNDRRSEALHVMNNNMKILSLLSEGIALASDSTAVLNRAFGPSKTAKGGEPRIGIA